MDILPNSDDEIAVLNVTNRRRTLFNRTINDNAILNRTVADIAKSEEKIAEEYCKELESEIESWKQAVKDSKAKNFTLKRKLAEDLKEYVDLDILDEEEKNFILSAPDYSQHIDRLTEAIYKAETVQLAKNAFEKYENIELLKLKSKIVKFESKMADIIFAKE